MSCLFIDVDAAECKENRLRHIFKMLFQCLFKRKGRGEGWVLEFPPHVTAAKLKKCTSLLLMFNDAAKQDPILGSLLLPIDTT